MILKEEDFFLNCPKPKINKNAVIICSAWDNSVSCEAQVRKRMTQPGNELITILFVEQPWLCLGLLKSGFYKGRSYHEEGALPTGLTRLVWIYLTLLSDALLSGWNIKISSNIIFLLKIQLSLESMSSLLP